MTLKTVIASATKWSAAIPILAIIIKACRPADKRIATSLSLIRASLPSMARSTRGPSGAVVALTPVRPVIASGSAAIPPSVRPLYSVPGEIDVLGFDIAVQKALAMHLLQAVHNPQHDINGHPER